MAVTAYKNQRLPHKAALCAICGLETRGKTTLVQLTHGVRFHLCAFHASVDFQQRNSGRDFVLTLTRIWHGGGCLTRARAKALSTFLEREQSRGVERTRERPGSYSWKALRNEVEHRAAAGEALPTILRSVRERHAHDVADVPSERTVRRWLQQRRWEDDDFRTPLRAGFARRDVGKAARAQRDRAPVVLLRETHAARRAERAAASGSPRSRPGARAAAATAPLARAP